MHKLKGRARFLGGWAVKTQFRLDDTCFATQLRTDQGRFLEVGAPTSAVENSERHDDLSASQFGVTQSANAARAVPPPPDWPPRRSVTSMTTRPGRPPNRTMGAATAPAASTASVSRSDPFAGYPGAVRALGLLGRAAGY